MMRSAWTWVPSLYFAEGIPYVLVMAVSVVLYKRLGVDNSAIALFTSLLYLPWVIKGGWSPLVDLVSSKRRWIVGCQFALALSLIGVAAAVTSSSFFALTVALFAAMAFFSATHDIAADGFYLLGLPTDQQAALVGVRSTFYRIAVIFGQGGLVVLAGILEPRFGVPVAWASALAFAAVVMALLAGYHRWWLPRPDMDRPAPRAAGSTLIGGIGRTFAQFFHKPRIGVLLAFLLFYRFAEAQLVKLVAPFLLDGRDQGGLGLTTSQVGIAYGTIGVIALLAGGILGGVAIATRGLRWWLWPMVVIMHAPDLIFVLLSQLQPDNFYLIAAAVAVEQFGYGFGFTAYTMFMIWVAEGEHKTSFYAICTAFMALGMMLPGMWSGWLQQLIGYRGFFLWVVASTIPGFVVAALVDIPHGFGRRQQRDRQG